MQKNAVFALFTKNTSRTGEKPSVFKVESILGDGKIRGEQSVYGSRAPARMIFLEDSWRALSG
jgi:hypothetical protein